MKGANMNLLVFKPELYQFDDCRTFVEYFNVQPGDLFFTSSNIFQKYFSFLPEGVISINRATYGPEEPTDVMVEAIANDVAKTDCKRIFAIGGGSVLDIAKILAVFDGGTVDDLYDNVDQIKKKRELILVPTTCGTGSEVTNLSIINRTRLGTKMGLASSEMFANSAVLIPELLHNLPFRVFATSSIDALVHAVESRLSPKATPLTKIFSNEAISTILKGYQVIKENGRDELRRLLPDFLLASTFAGLAFGTAGCAAVHALSYPLGGTYHVAHGESNYAMFTGVLNKYMSIKSDGEIAKLNSFLASILDCDTGSVYQELESLLNDILEKKPLNEYGVTESDLKEFTEVVMTKQGRLMANNFVPLTEGDVYDIYKSLY